MENIDLILRKLDELNKKIERLSDYIDGNGSPERGIIVRLDRLEQSEQKRSWLLKTTIAAALGALASSIITWFKFFS